MVRAIEPHVVWERSSRGEIEVLDLRTRAERKRYGWPPGARRVSLMRHMVRPRGPNTVYLCQHAGRSKLTGRRGATEVAHGWKGWKEAELPIQRHGDRDAPRA